MVTDSNPGQTDDALSSLPRAIKDLEQAEEHLAHVRAEEAVAEREVKDAIEEVKEAEHDRDQVEVHVVHVNEAEKASFREQLDATLQKVWDKSYEELKLQRQPRDIFQTGGEHPKSLMSDLGLTLAQARDRKVITDFRFGIASETGGA